MKIIPVRLTDEQHERLRVLSFETRKSMAAIIRDAIGKFLSKHPIKPGQEWFWDSAWQEKEKQIEVDLAAGDHETFNTIDEFISDLIKEGE